MELYIVLSSDSQIAKLLVQTFYCDYIDQYLLSNSTMYYGSILQYNFEEIVTQTELYLYRQLGLNYFFLVNWYKIRY